MAKKGVLTTSDPLMYNEFERFLDCLHKDGLYQWEAYARISFATACRAGDVLKLKWGDILGKSFLVITEEKTDKTRKVPFNPSVQNKMKELWELLDCPDKKDFILQSRYGFRKDEGVSIQYVNQMLKKFKYKYGLKIDNLSTHSFRKTFGRFVYETNNKSAESLILLNKILNHSSISVTKAYLGITQEEVAGVFNSIQF